MPRYLKFVLVLMVVVWYTQALETTKPNIIFILADDLGMYATIRRFATLNCPIINLVIVMRKFRLKQ